MEPMDEDARQRSGLLVRETSIAECNRVRRRQHQQQRQQQQDQRDPYSRVYRELPEKQHQTRHPACDDPDAGTQTGDQ